MRKKEDLTGRKFGRLIALHYSGVQHGTNVSWACLCSCGNIKNIRETDLKNGHTKSCGCFRRDFRYKHGESKTNLKRQTRLYNIWTGMKSRCYNKKDTGYRYYGRRGIAICNEWRDNYNTFKSWAILNGYKENLTIDRINNDGNYEPDNCQWITAKENIIKIRNERCI